MQIFIERYLIKHWVDLFNRLNLLESYTSTFLTIENY